MSEADTRTLILDAAQDLVQRLGANAVSDQHLSEAVGIRKASIHYYFPAKEDLLEAKHDKACLCGMLGAELASLGDEAAKGIRRFYKANQERLASILERGRD